MKEIDGQLKYCYMIGIDASSLATIDKNGNKVLDPTTGKFVLARDGIDFVTFQNTIVHELFHAFMDDYNRTGMTGTLEPEDAIRIYANNYTPSEEDNRMTTALNYPQWFMEGSASAMENVYSFRFDNFKRLMMVNGQPVDVLDKDTLFTNFLNATDPNGSYAFYPLTYAKGGSLQLPSGEQINVDTKNARYVSGYLATLYLGELAYKTTSAGDSARSALASGQPVFSADKIRSGINSILQWMHNGKTLDKIIQEISVDENGESSYSSTDDFTNKCSSRRRKARRHSRASHSSQSKRSRCERRGRSRNHR